MGRKKKEVKDKPQPKKTMTLYMGMFEPIELISKMGLDYYVMREAPTDGNFNYKCEVDVTNLVELNGRHKSPQKATIQNAESIKDVDIAKYFHASNIKEDPMYLLYNRDCILSCELIEKAEPTPEVKEGLDELKEVAKVFDGTEFGELFNDIIKTILNAEKMPKLGKTDKEQLIGMFEKLVNAGIESMEKETKEPNIVVNINIGKVILK